MSDKERWEEEKEKQQTILKHDYAKKITKRDVTDEEAERIICAELKDDDVDEYLVDGAILTCTGATWDSFPLSDGEAIKLDGADEERMKGEPTEYLRVPENPMSVNDLRYATVADTKKNWNIMPFPCNCKEPALPNQEITIKENKVDCQSHGVCKYLMELEEEWENCDFQEILSFAPTLLVPYEDFKDQEATSESEDTLMSEIWKRGEKEGKEKKGVTMTSILFCKHGGFIYPRTSGQTVLLGGISEFLSDYELTGKQYMALYEIRNYMTKNPELLTGTAIFVFEGLATSVPTEGDRNNPEDEINWNGANIYHPKGQFGAIVIATVDGKPKYAVMKASTLPDNMEKAATICEGIYEAGNVNHGAKRDKDGNIIIDGYAAVQLNNSGEISAYNSRWKNDSANGIHFHMAAIIRSNDPDKPYSEGCITIPVREYVKFGKKVGFITEDTDEKIGQDNSYGNAKSALSFFSHSKDFNGYMVIDRQYYEDEGNYLKFNGPRGEE